MTLTRKTQNNTKWERGLRSSLNRAYHKGGVMRPENKMKKYHLLRDIGVYKGTVKRNFDADYSERGSGDEFASRVRELLGQRTQYYTLDEIWDLVSALGHAHDTCVLDYPEDFVTRRGAPSIEIWKAEQNEKRQEELEKLLRKLAEQEKTEQEGGKPE